VAGRPDLILPIKTGGRSASAYDELYFNLALIQFVNPFYTI
jgi:hypothetical protein